MRRIDDDHGRFGGDGIGKCTAVERPEAFGVRGRGNERHRGICAVSQCDGGFVRVVVRLDDDDVAAGFEMPQGSGGNRLRGSDRDEAFGVGIVDLPRTAGAIGDDGLAEYLHTAAGSVLVISASYLMLRLREHLRRPVPIREALPKIDCIVLSGEAGHGGENGLAERAQAGNGHGFTVGGRLCACCSFFRGIAAGGQQLHRLPTATWCASTCKSSRCCRRCTRQRRPVCCS